MVQPKSVKLIQTAKIGSIIMSFIIAAFGVFLLVSPKISAPVLGRVMGLILIVFGIVKLLGYFSKDLFRLAFQFDLAFGILMVTLGVILLFNPKMTLSIICVAFGICILTDALFKIQIALDSKRFGLHFWWLILVFAALAGIAGILLIFRPTDSVLFWIRLMGIALVAESALNLDTVLTAVKIIRHQMPDDLLDDETRKD